MVCCWFEYSEIVFDLSFVNLAMVEQLKTWEQLSINCHYFETEKS
jgi:hypothetical protein